MRSQVWSPQGGYTGGAVIDTTYASDNEIDAFSFRHPCR